jgi:hypothetical protein
MGMTRTFAHVVKNEGVIGLFRGLMPPLMGSSIFRSVQFGVRFCLILHFVLLSLGLSRNPPQLVRVSTWCRVLRCTTFATPQ